MALHKLQDIKKTVCEYYLRGKELCTLLSSSGFSVERECVTRFSTLIFSPINWPIDKQIEIFSISPRFSNIKLEQILTPRFLHCAGQRGVNTLDCLINFLKRVYFHQCLPLKRFYVRCPDHRGVKLRK